MAKKIKKKITKNSRKAPKKVGKFLYWSPRILSIIFILFLALFSLDVFDSCNGFLDCALALFMHNLPVIVLAIVMFFAWKHELVGAIAFGLAGLLYICLVLVQVLKGNLPWYIVFSWSMTIAGPALITAYLFYLNWKKKRS